jgi:hypothetical protein
MQMQYGKVGNLYIPANDANVINGQVLFNSGASSRGVTGLSFETHLQAGTSGTALGAAFWAYAEGTNTQLTALGGATGMGAFAASTVGGDVFGINPFVRCQTTACRGIIGMEIDTDNQINGTSSKKGIQIVDVTTSVGTITGSNVAIHILAVAPAVGYQTAIAIGDPASAAPLTSGGVIIKGRNTANDTISTGFDLTNFTMSSGDWSLTRNAHYVTSYNAGGTATKKLIGLNASDKISLYDGIALLSAAGNLQLGASGTLGNITLGNATSGTITVQPVTGALGSVTLSLPAATDTLVGKATTDTFTNKTFDTAATGNSFSINGVAATANTGTGAVVRATSPTLVTPALGVATVTTINGVTINSSTGTLSLASGKTLTVSNTLTLAGVDSTTITFQGTDTYVGRATTDTLTNKTIGAATLSGTLSGGGNQINNVIIGTSTPLAGFFTTLSATTSLTSPIHYGGTTASSSLSLESTSGAGTTDSIGFYTASQTYRGGINTSGQWTLGPNVTPNTSVVLTVNANTVAPAGLNGGNTIAQFTGANSTKATILLDSFAGANNLNEGLLVIRKARGTQASPTAILSGDFIGFFGLVGATGAGTFASADGSNGGIFFGATATENWSLTNQGSALTIYATANGAAAVQAEMQIQTGICIGCTANPGLGSLQINAQIFMPNITTSSAAQTGTVCWTTGTGKFTVDTTVGCLTSIGAAKNIVSHVVPRDALGIVSRLDTVSFRYKDGYGDSGRYEQFGFVAEQVASVDERLVGRDPNGTLQGVRYQELTAVLAGAIRELKADNDNLRAANDNLAARLAKLEAVRQ